MNCFLHLYAEINASSHLLWRDLWPEKLKEETNENHIVQLEEAYGYEETIHRSILTVSKWDITCQFMSVFGRTTFIFQALSSVNASSYSARNQGAFFFVTAGFKRSKMWDSCSRNYMQVKEGYNFHSPSMFWKSKSASKVASLTFMEICSQKLISLYIKTKRTTKIMSYEILNNWLYFSNKPLQNWL